MLLLEKQLKLEDNSELVIHTIVIIIPKLSVVDRKYIYEGCDSPLNLIHNCVSITLQVSEVATAQQI